MWSENSDNNSFEVETFVGRTLEKERLREAAGGPQSAFVAVYGRRRVGKTMLIRHVFNNDFTFQATAVANVDKQQQLINFTTALRRYDGREELVVPTTWFAAFQQLIDYLEQCNESRKVIFLDELPWFDNQRSDFIQSLEHFWNSWAATRTDIVLLVCGSAASWMINELINHRGGLHNRVTERILVEPFNLKETEQLLKIKNPAIDRYQVLQLYMVMGGIPFYLNAVKKTESAAQNIDRLFFTRDGLLRNEFDNLYRALFRRSERHIAVVRAIATKAKGLSRKEILQLTQLPDNSTLNQTLDELETSGFIRKYAPFNRKKRDRLYQLVDFYTLFYLRFVEDHDPVDGQQWLNAIDHPSRRAWSGYTFERVCWYHLPQIKQALGIAGVYSQSSNWRNTEAQIDLLIDRRDQVINVCEMKFSIAPFTITKQYAEQLLAKVEAFRSATQTNKALYLTFLTTKGLVDNNWSKQLAQYSITMDALFE